MLRRFALLFLLIFFAVTVFAQVSAPPRDQTQAAVLADMSRRTGETVTINSMGYQQWHYGSYEYVRGLGCPASPQTPPTSGNWQRFVFNYRGFDYIYLISDNLQSLILCNEASLPTAIAPTAQATATQQGTGQSGGGVAATATPALPTATLQGSGQSGGGFAATEAPTCLLAPRLQIGAGGRVTPGEANWVHEQATRNSTKTGEIPAGGEFDVISGPVCDAVTGMNYWQVNYDGLVGWTSEGLNGEYWLEPLNSDFSQENVNDVALIPWTNNFSTGDWITVISPDSQLILFGNQQGTLRLFRTKDGTEVGAILSDGAVTSLSFSPDSTQIFIGAETGNVQILETGALNSSYTLSHEGSITHAISNSSMTLLLVADSSGVLTFWALPVPDAPLRRIQLPEVAGALEFSADYSLLLVRDLEGNFLTALQIP